MVLEGSIVIQADISSLFAYFEKKIVKPYGTILYTFIWSEKEVTHSLSPSFMGEDISY